MIVAETERLRIRWFDAGDADFIVELVNEPSWIRYIGDKKVRTREDAIAYLERGPVASYQQRGFGLNLVALKATGAPIGMCGLIKRDTLEDVDLGFAFLPGAWGRGYAHEAAAAVMAHGRRILGVERVVAILSKDNDRSARLLEKLGFRRERTIAMPPDDEELLFYATAA